MMTYFFFLFDLMLVSVPVLLRLYFFIKFFSFHGITVCPYLFNFLSFRVARTT